MDFRSTSFNNNGESSARNDNFPRYSSGMRDLRCYSASYVSSYSAAEENRGQKNTAGAANGGRDLWEFRKGKSTNDVVSKSWSFNDAELQRKKRVAGYKAHAVEGKMKGSIKKSFKWLRKSYTLLFHGRM